MFEINKYMLTKMGWITYSQSRGIRIGNSITFTKPVKPLEGIVFEDDPLVRFFFDDKEKKVCYVVKELSDNEKQKSKNSYKFVALLCNFTEFALQCSLTNSAAVLSVTLQMIGILIRSASFVI